MQEQEPMLGSPDAAGQPDGPGAEQAQADLRAEAMPSPEQVIRNLELQAQEHYDAWLRAKAEADNIRKRAQADIANAH